MAILLTFKAPRAVLLTSQRNEMTIHTYDQIVGYGQKGYGLDLNMLKV